MGEARERRELIQTFLSEILKGFESLWKYKHSIRDNIKMDLNM
jgi:hypothetical protein